MRASALAAAFLVLGWFAVPVSAAEEAELADLSAWTLGFQRVYRQYLGVLSQVSGIDALTRDLVEGGLGHGKAAEKLTGLDKRLVESLDAAAAARERLTKPPEVSRPLMPVRKAALNNHSYLGALDGVIRKARNDALGLFAAAGLGEEVGARLMQRPLRQMAIILKSDTVMLNAKLPLYDRRQPEEQLTRAIIAANTAFVIIVDAVGLQLSGMEDVAKEQTGAVREILDRGMDAVNRGRQVARQTWFLTPQARSVGREAFQESFSVEERSNMLLREFANGLLGKKGVAALGPVIEDHRVKLRFLVEERLRLQEQRPVAAY